MEDDDEIRSHASPKIFDSPDPSPSPPAGRITVTVASAPPPHPDSLALALIPAQTSGGAGGNRPVGGGGREDCWSEGATGVLIDAWGERYMELSRGNLKQKHWQEVAEIVSRREDYGKTPKTDVQCKNRIDTVKKKYKQEKVRISSGGGGRSRWVFFDKLDRLIGSTAAKIPTESSGGGLNKIPMGIPMNNRSNLYNQTPPVRSNFDRLIGATARVSSGGSVNVPMGIPMSNRSNPFVMPQQQMVKTFSEPPKRWRFRKRNDSDSENGAMSDDSGDSLPPPTLSKRFKAVENESDGDGVGEKWRELSRAIMRFGEAYEQIENAKVKQAVEMEKERMKFSKELELQRMQFFMRTQVEVSQRGRRIENIGNGKNNNNVNAIVNADMGN